MKWIKILACSFVVIMFFGCQPESITLCDKDPVGPGVGSPCGDTDYSAQFDYYPSGPKFNWILRAGTVPVASDDYTLIYYRDCPDEEGCSDGWPGKGLICLAEGILSSADNEIAETKNCEDLGTDLPTAGDLNTTGAKIWLVLSDDVDCLSDPPQMTTWDPDSYLFEGSLINYEDIDG